MIVITGGAGFIGSCIAAELNARGEKDLLLVDELECNDKWKNLRRLDYDDYLDKSALFDFLKHRLEGGAIQAVIHMGACSSTTETNAAYLMENNYRYTLRLAELCLEHKVRFIYASSAATYGDGAQGYCDNEDEIYLKRLLPLNMYGYSKHLFDLKARREGWLNRIAGVKFFNVYGPNEYHKADMTSVVYKAFHQIREKGEVKLFKSHRADYQDGGQLRDFVYVKDAVKMVLYLLENEHVNGLYNVGTGQARSFKDLALASFRALKIEPKIAYIDMPEALRDRYQYYTQAEMEKLRDQGYSEACMSLEDGVADYVAQLLRDFA